MKTNYLNKQMKQFLSGTALFMGIMALSNLSYAGDRVGNGGDECERKLLSIQDEIKSWILRYDEKFLKLPEEITHGEYRSKMFDAIDKTVISCTDKKLFVGDAEKTCKNFGREDGTNILECNIDRTTKTPEAGLYNLQHHEYAGLAGIETNDGDERSKYFVTNQLSAYMKEETVIRLAIVPNHYQLDRCGVYLKKGSWFIGNPNEAVESIKKILVDKGYTINSKPDYSYLKLTYFTQKGMLLVDKGYTYEQYANTSRGLVTLESKDESVSVVRDSQKGFLLWTGNSISRLKEATKSLPNCNEIK